MTLPLVRQRRFEELPAPQPADVRPLSPDHPAVLQKLPLFEDSVVKASESPRLFIPGDNNRKIGRVVTKGAWRGMPIYTLTLAERMTCPISCHMYLSCYGNAMPFARRHAPGPELEARIPQELAALADKHRDGFVVRLHVLGDFYSVEYVGMWDAMLAQHQGLRIFGYTARMRDTADLAIGNALFQLRDKYRDRFAIRPSESRPLKGAVMVIDRVPEGPTVSEGIVCPAEREATACCATCGLCWEESARDKTIVFLRHGMGSNKSDKIARSASMTDSSGTRKIEPIANLSKLAGHAENEPPTLMWIKPTDLQIDEAYQRSLSRKSISLISRIVQNWNWTHFKPPIVVKDEDRNAFYVLDGQHTAIAAASHPSIDKIPVMIVDAVKHTDRAKAFIGHNRDRITVTPTQLYHSSIVAQDPEALAVEQVCRQAGVRILRQAPPKGSFSAGDTVALSSIRSLIRSKGAEKALTVLSCLVAAKRAPVRADEMKAVAHWMFGTSSDVEPGHVVKTLHQTPYEEALREARDVAASAALPLAEAMAAVYAKKMNGHGTAYQGTD